MTAVSDGSAARHAASVVGTRASSRNTSAPGRRAASTTSPQGVTSFASNQVTATVPLASAATLGLARKRTAPSRVSGVAVHVRPESDEVPSITSRLSRESLSSQVAISC